MTSDQDRGTPMNADRAWTCLVVNGGAIESERAEFVHYVETHDYSLPFEYRFRGHFGFGGKVRIRDDRFVADYYPEDRTPERQEQLKTLNAKLAKIG